MRRKKLAFLFGLLVLGLLAGAIITQRVLKYGFSAHDEPTALEVMAARTARKLAAPEGARQLRNPLPQTHENLAQGMEFWATSCAVCHGNNGSGRTTIGRNIYPKAPDMRLSTTQNLSDGRVVLHHHKRDSPDRHAGLGSTVCRGQTRRAEQESLASGPVRSSPSSTHAGRRTVDETHESQDSGRKRQAASRKQQVKNKPQKRPRLACCLSLVAPSHLASTPLLEHQPGN